MHKILERQLQRHYGSLEKVPGELRDFLEVVGKTYSDYDREYALIERSLNISSKESQELNESLRREATEAKKRADDLERFNKLVIDRELKMVELKKEIGMLKKNTGGPA